MSGRELARQIGRSNNYVATRLRCEASFTLSDIDAIADVLDFDAASFLIAVSASPAAPVSAAAPSVSDAMDISEVHGANEEKKSTYGLAAKRGRRKADQEPHAD
jgi:transcriptional regulator with XRE-family HTH domain